MTLVRIVPNYQSHDGRHCLIYLGYVGTKCQYPFFLDHCQSTGTDSQLHMKGLSYTRPTLHTYGIE